MKYFLLLLFILPTTIYAQNEHIFLYPDSTTNCQSMASGKFKEVNTSSKEYVLEISGNIITEYVQNRKYYVRSKLRFTNSCSYTATITEVTIPNYNLKPGAIFNNEILETSNKFIKIKARQEDNEAIIVLEKIK